MEYPNKTDMIAAAIYGLMAANADLRKEADLPLWGQASAEDRKLCLDAAGFLMSYTFGADLRTMSVDDLAKAFGKSIPKENKLHFATQHEAVVLVFLNLSSLLK